jgi:hypothetical protein
MFRKLLQADGWCRKIGIDMPAEHNDAVKQFASMTSEERRGINDDGLVELSKLIRSSVLPLSNRILGTSTHIEFVLDKNLEGFIQKYMLNLWVRKAIFETDPASSGFNDLYVKFSRITSSKTHDLMLRRLGRRDLRNPNV